MTILEMILSAGLTVVGALCTAIIGLLRARLLAVEQKSEHNDASLQSFKLEVLRDSKEYVTASSMREFVSGMEKFKDAVFRKLDSIEGDVREMSDTFRDKLEKKADKKAGD